MRLTFILPLFLMLGTVLFAQDVSNVQFGPDNQQKTKILKVLGESNGKIFALAGNKSDYFVQKYDEKSLGIENHEKMDLPKIEGISDLSIEEIFLLEKEIVVFMTGFNKTKNSFQTFAYQVNEKCKMKSTGKLILDLPVEKKKRLGSVGFHLNTVTKQVLIYQSNYVKERGVHRFTFALLDETLEEIKDGSFEVEKTDLFNACKVMDAKVDHSGNVCAVLSQYPSGEEDQVNGLSNQKIMTATFLKKDHYSAKVAEIKLAEDQIANDLMVIVTAEGLKITGFYTKLIKKKGKGLEGTLLVSVDKEGEIGDVVSTQFSEAFKKRFDEEKVGIKLPGIPITVRLREVFVDSDNNITLLAENEIHDPESSGVYYGYVLIARITNQGEFKWEQLVGKKQSYVSVSINPAVGGGAVSVFASFNLTSTDKGNYLSYGSWMTEDNDLVLLFLDTQKNADTPTHEERKIMLKPLDATPFSAKITADGSLTYTIESKLQESDIPIRPKYSFVHNRKLYFVSSKKETETIGSATVK